MRGIVGSFISLPPSTTKARDRTHDGIVHLPDAEAAAALEAEEAAAALEAEEADSALSLEAMRFIRSAWPRHILAAGDFRNG